MFKRAIVGLAAATLLALAACAPVQSSSSTTSAPQQQAGTLKVWLFSEVTQAPKEKVVDEAIAEFEKAHQGVKVSVQYLPVDTRAERFKAAFNDPSSAPDVAEFGNTDLAGYQASGALADLTADIEKWSEAADIDPAVLATTEIDGKKWAVPWYIGVRALYYRTDIFDELKLEPPTTMAEVEKTAKAIRAAKPDMRGIATGGAAQFSYLPYLWAHGGEIAADEGGEWSAKLDSPEAIAGLEAYARLVSDDICPPQTCAEWGGNASVQDFIAGNAGMTIGGDFNRKAVDESEVGDTYKVIPLPGLAAGSIAPAFAGGNHLGVFKGSTMQDLGFDFIELLAGKNYQAKMFEAMGNLSTYRDVQADQAASVPELKPFIDTLAAGTKFVPVTPAWNQIDAQGTLTAMIQEVVTGKAEAPAAAKTAVTAMNEAFAG